jgi:hypothetical protein
MIVVGTDKRLCNRVNTVLFKAFIDGDVYLIFIERKAMQVLIRTICALLASFFG